MTKMILNNKGITYEYKLIGDLLIGEQDKYLDMAQQTGQLSFPLLIKNDKIITLQEIN
jgi:glutaredoxin